MRITITPDSRPGQTVTLIDGSWLNLTWLSGEITGLVKDGLEGWYDSLAPRDADPTAIPQQNGSYWPAMVNLQHRVVTIRGVHRAGRHRGGSSLQVAGFRDWLAALVGEALTIEVEDQSGVRTVTGYVTAQIPLEMPDGFTTKFSLIITCPDPVKYGLPVQYPASEGKVRVENQGTADVWCRFVVSGSVSALTATLGDSTIQWQGPAGQGLSIDTYDALPLRDGALVGTLLQDDLFKIPPGVHDIAVSATAGASVAVEVRPGWL